MRSPLNGIGRNCGGTCGEAERLGPLGNRCTSTDVVLVLTPLRHRTSWELAKQRGAQACFHKTHTSGEDLEKAIWRAIAFREGRGPVDVNNRFPRILGSDRYPAEGHHHYGPSVRILESDAHREVGTSLDDSTSLVIQQPESLS